MTPSELWNNKGDKRNTNTKTPVECEKCISHPNLMIQNAFSEKKKNFHISAVTAVHVGITGVCVYTDQAYVCIRTLRSRSNGDIKLTKNKKLTAALYIKIMLFDVHVLILFTFIGVLC